MDGSEAVVLDPMDAEGRPAKPKRFLVLWLTLAVWVALVAVLGLPAAKGGLAGTLGDTDDALRLVLVRDLIQGHAGWYDQHFGRVQPPFGMDLHWSRLVDGGIAGVELAYRAFLSPAQAEYAARATWPLLWLGPAVAAIIAIARRLRGDNAAIACAVVLGFNGLLFAQWIAGRIDHHDLQMTAALVALAGGMSGGRRGAVLAGVATAAGLAVGIEALIFLATVGAFLAVRFAADPTRHTRPARAYAASLLVGLLVLYAAETPPAWWGVSRCDTIAANLTLAVVIACLGILALTWLSARGRLATRFLGLAVIGALAAGAYVAMQPACLHGPFALSDPRIAPLWLSKVAEMQSLLKHARQFQVLALNSLVLTVSGLASWLWLGRRKELRSGAWVIAGGCFLIAAAAGLSALRLSGYTSLFAAPLVAAAAADLTRRLRPNHRIVAAGLALALSPSACVSAITRVAPTDVRRAAAAKTLGCTAPAAYATLAKLPTGVVLNEIDIGPYILATTTHSVLAAPYHRASWGIVAGDAAFAAPPGRDEAAVRRLHADYVVECPHNAWYPRRQEMGPESLLVRLDRAKTPAWLEPLSHPGEPLQVYRVRPPSY